ncbi:MAG: hypothetical protein IT356_12345 [Gemmatimonadaceae bacterium]|nr:hypothetical protein [Gemmatimonadaceae bacterium]
MISIPSKFLPAALAAAALVTLASAVATAQDAEALRRQFTIKVPQTAAAGGLADLFRGAPGTNTGTPLAFGPGMGDFFIGGGYQASTRGYKGSNGVFSDNGGDDGSISAGFGLGDATDGIGLTTVITSLSTFRSGFGNRTAFSFQAFRNLNPSTAVAVGVENAFIAGGQKTDGADSWYGVISHVYQQPSADMAWLKAVTVSAGVGNGRFRTTADVRKDNKTVNAFASVALLVHDQVSFIGDYTGQDVNVGMSIVPFKSFPVSITPALVDLTGTASKSPRFTIGAGVGLHF